MKKGQLHSSSEGNTIKTMDIYLVTRNKGKLLAANSAFDNTGIFLKPVERDYPEIQADTSAEIAKYTALEAAKNLGAPAIREDHSLVLNALDIPGPYMNYFEKHVPPEKILKILERFNDRSGYFEVATAYAEPDGEVQQFSFRVPFRISKEMRGKLQTGWNKILVLEGETRTLAEYPETERTHIWNKNYLAIVKYLKENSKIS